MKVHLAYGKKGLDVEIPDKNLVKILTMKGASPLHNPSQALRSILREPIECKPLSEMVVGKRSACIVLCDITRPVPNKLLLPPVLEILENAGIARKNITLLIATGLHRSSTPEERRYMVGEAIAEQYRIVDHRARVGSEQHYLGKTRNETPVYIDEAYCAADVKISLGFIEPHLMAGFSGGRKMVAPGCAGEETIKALHSPFFLENPHCREGSLGRNPLHHEIVEIARMAGHDFIVNVTLNEGGDVTGIFAGHPERAHAVGVEFVRTSVRATLREQVDIVVTTSAGFPLDLTYYQAIKGMTAALPVVRRGGLLILAAECSEGLGGKEFSAMARRFSSAEEFRRHILRHPVEIDQWQLEECAKAVLHADVVLVSSGVQTKECEGLFIGSANSVEEAIERGLRQYGDDSTIAVIPKGPYTLAEIENASI
jgi:nickel-dependent lactate racemase